MKPKYLIIPRLSEIYESSKEELPGECSPTNIDDAFRVVVELGIPDISVSRKEMFIIAQFTIANLQGKFSGDVKELDKKVWELLREGKVDKFFGVNLHLEL